MERTITEEKINKYLLLTEKALSIIKEAKKHDEKAAKTIIEMAENYLSDAKHFQTAGDLVNSFGAVNYAHGWIDCGAMLGIYEVSDDQLFTIKD